jgi:hypothetical protein
MKNVTKLIGIIALVAVIGFSFTACDDGNGGGGGTHTHSYSTTWLFNATQHWHECSCGDKTDVANHTGDPCTVCGYSSSGGSLIINGLPSGSYSVQIFPSGTDISTMSAVIAAQASNKDIAIGNINGNVFKLLATLDDEIWTGSGNFQVLLSVGNQYRYATVSFSNGIGTAQYSSFTVCGVSGDGLTVTGLPSGDYGVYIFPSGTDISTKTAFFTAYNNAVSNGTIILGKNFNGGNVFTLGTFDDAIWTGSGNFQVVISSDQYLYATVSFSNGSGTVQYSSFTAVAD